MAETQIRRIIDTDGKTYDIVYDESSRTLETNSAASVVIIRDAILAATGNSFTSDQATAIAINAVLRGNEEDLFL